MKIVTIKKKNILTMAMIIVFTIIVCGFSTSFGMQHYYKVDFSTGLVTATNLNVRSGPGTQYKIVTTVPKNQYIRVFAGIGDWYVVQVEGDYIGAASKKYIKAIYPDSSNSGSSGNTNQNTQTSTLSADEQEVFNLIYNSFRT